MDIIKRFHGIFIGSTSYYFHDQEFFLDYIFTVLVGLDDMEVTYPSIIRCCIALFPKLAGQQ